MEARTSSEFEIDVENAPKAIGDHATKQQVVAFLEKFLAEFSGKQKLDNSDTVAYVKGIKAMYEGCIRDHEPTAKSLLDAEHKQFVACWRDFKIVYEKFLDELGTFR